MRESMDDLYYDWLKETILPAPNGKHYNSLIETLYSEEFVPMITTDENRAIDGIRLRDHFSEGYDNGRPCSILEMMIAVAGRFEGNSGFDRGDSYENFWTLVSNMDLDKYYDMMYEDYEVKRKLYIFSNRTYEFNGKGGLFPLKKPEKDQRKVDIWEQMQAYLVENYGV